MDAEMRDALRRGTATRVMGWHEDEVEWASRPAEPVWHDADDLPLVPVEAWRPDLDEAQCARVLERMVERGFELAMAGSADGYEVRFGDGRGRHANRRAAILLAALDASGAGD